MSSGYRLAPALAARILGAALVALAVLLLLTTLLVVLLDGSSVVVLGVGALALVGVLGLGQLLRQRRVVELDDAGYRVRWVRGAGVKAARWGEVADAVAASPRGVECVVLRLKDGRTTSIPVAAVAAPREEFVEDVREHLRRAEGLKPL
jgi:hypothetical protein